MSDIVFFYPPQGSPQTVEQSRCAAILLAQRHYTHFQC